MPEQTFRVVGDIDLSSAEELQEALLSLVNATNDNLVLDCEQLQFIDSSGVAVFMHTWQLLELQGRKMRVTNLNGMARRAFEVLGLLDLLDITDNERA